MGLGCYRLYRIYEEGDVMAGQNKARATKYFRIAQEEHYPMAYNDIGNYFAEIGKECENKSLLESTQAYEEAHEHYRLAALQGLTVAMLNLASLYLYHIDIPEGHEKAKKLCDLAFVQDAGAVKNLLHVYIEGRSGKQDLARAGDLCLFCAEHKYYDISGPS